MTVIPKGWRVLELDALKADGGASLVGGPFGSDLTQRDYVIEPGVPVIRGTNLDGKNSRFVDEGFVYVNERKALQLSKNLAFPGDLIFTQRGTLGQVAIIPQSARFSRYVISQSQMKLTPDANIVDRDYLYHFFRAPRTVATLMSETQATGVPHINLGILKRFPVVVPPLLEQRRIAEILVKADALRAKRHAAFVHLDTVTKSIFLDMFGDPSTNPKRFCVREFASEIASVRYGTGSPPAYVADGVPFIRATNVKQGTIASKDLKRISIKDAERLSKCRVRSGDLIIVRSGINTGDCALVPELYDGACAAFDLIVELPRKSAVFYNYLINSAYGKAHLEPLTRRAAQPHLNAEQLRSLRFISPPPDEKARFADTVAAIERIRTTQTTSLGQVNALFASLQDRAFRGEL